MRRRVLLMLFATAALLAPAGLGQQEPEALWREGKAALEAGEFERARELLAAADRSSRGSSTLAGVTPAAVPKETRAGILFDLALTYQLAAEATGDRPSLKRAAKVYEGVLELKPKSASTHHNLGRVYQRLRRLERAEAHYRKAILAAQADRPFYRRKYADFLKDTRQWPQAVAVYEQIARDSPQDVDTHRILLDRYLDFEANGIAPLMRYLWRLVDRGEVVRAQDAALEALEKGSPRKLRTELLTVVAASLGRQSVKPSKFLESTTGERLQSLERDPVIGQGAAELVAVFTTPGDYASDFRWWSRQGDARQEPQRGVWPRDAFQDLMRRVGAWYEERDAEIAEECYRTAATLSRKELDVRAFQDLVEFYAEQDKTEKLESVAREVAGLVSDDDLGTYRRDQLQNVYDYHKSLGQFYGHLAGQGEKAWGDTDTPATALFQLDRAYQAGKLLDDQVPGEGGPGPPPRLHLDPGVVDLLAQGYAATGAASGRQELIERGNEVRVESAERFVASGDRRSAAKVLEPVSAAELSPIQRQRYQVSTEAISRGAVDVGENRGTVRSPAPPERTVEPDGSERVTPSVPPGRVVMPDGRSLAPQIREILTHDLGQGAVLRFPTGGRGAGLREAGPRNDELMAEINALAEQLSVVLRRGPADVQALWQEMGPSRRLKKVEFDGTRGLARIEIEGEVIEVPFEVTGESGDRHPAFEYQPR